LRTAELSYLESYEKYFMLYNSLNVKDYKTAIQYLWLFQKLNTSSISGIEVNTTSLSNITNQTNDQNVFRFFSKQNTNNLIEQQKNNSTNCVKRNEQNMHLKAILTIYLANS
jgi:hypothetical protein